MKKAAKLLFHLLGSVQFAIVLIAALALFVVAGTVIESTTGSHRLASFYTYKSPAFLLLLAFFFVNILFAALRRWPYQIRHIPFLLTHLGLLMILAGTILKSLYGLQGVLLLKEGSGSHEVFLPETYAVKLKKREEGQILSGMFALPQGPSPFPELQVELASFSPNGKEELETWFKGSFVQILGLPPLPLCDLEKGERKSLKVRLFEDSEECWELAAWRVKDVQQAARLLFLQELEVSLTDRKDGTLLCKGYFSDLSKEKALWEGGSALISLRGELCSDTQQKVPALLTFLEKEKLTVATALCGTDALVNCNETTPYLGSASVAVDLSHPPQIAFLQGPNDENWVVAFSPDGSLFWKQFPKEGPSSLVIYDEGFGGYCCHVEIPVSSKPRGRQAAEEKIFQQLREELSQAVSQEISLSPPLALFHRSCLRQGLDFASVLLDFLKEWDRQNSWILHTGRDLSSQVQKALFGMERFPSDAWKACFWISRVFQEADPLLKRGENPKNIAVFRSWPIPLGEENSSQETLLYRITQQIFSAAAVLPEPDIEEEDLPSLFSAYLRACGIHLQSIRPELPLLPEKPLILETPLTTRQSSEPPLAKLEENRPLASLRFTKNGHSQQRAFCFEEGADGLFWPILGGEYLARLQADTMEIPYHLRLRQARQINYPGSNQALSFEADLLVTDLHSGSFEEVALSMNRVFEAPGGYRFYLSSLSDAGGMRAKRVQLIVNRDPAKYLLTYPGAVVAALGTLLLLWRKRKSTIS